MFSWTRIISKCFVGKKANRTNRLEAKHPRFLQLRFDILEDRITPSVYDYTGATLDGTYATIQQAVSAASAGDIIKADAGTYSENVQISTNGLTIQGAQYALSALTRSTDSGVESVVDGTSNGGKTPFYVTANDVTIEGFTIQGATSPNDFGYGIVLGAGYSGAHILNNVIQDNVVGISLANNSSTDQAVIQDNLIQNNNEPGPSSGTGIYTDQYDAQGTVSDVLIDSNTLANNGTAGIGFSSSDDTKPDTDITISNNTFNGNGQGMYAFNLTSSSITNNTFENSTQSGEGWGDIQLLEGTSQVSVTNNLMENGASFALELANAGTGAAAATGVTFADNSMSGYDSGGVAVQIDSGSAYAGTLDASGNWWGTAIGANPTDSTAPTAINALISGSVTVAAFLDSGANTAAATTGFAPALSTEIWVPQTAATSRLTYVDGNIQEGVDLAASGMTVRVAADTYYELVQVTKTVTLDGAQAGVDARTRGAVPESIISNGDGDVQILADNVTIDGFTLTGVVNDPSSDPTSLGAAIWSNPGFSGTHGGQQILNNIITGNIAGIELDNDGTYQAKVQYNLIENNNQPGAGGGNGIETDFGLADSLIDSNTFINNPNASIALFAGSTNTISNNSADNSIAILNMANTQITGNVLTNPLYDGIYVFGGDNGVTISDNEVTDPVTAGSAGVYVGDPYSVAPNSGVTITNNILHSTASTYGVFIDVSGGAAFSDVDPLLVSEIPLLFMHPPLLVSGNALTGAGIGIENDQAGLAVDASANYWGSSDPATVSARIVGAGAASVDFTPLLDNNESVANQAVVGFQPDFSSLTVVPLGAQTGATGRIQEAIDLLADGALTGGARIVNVAAGTYSGSVSTVGTPLTLAVGAGPGQVVIDGDLSLDSSTTLSLAIDGASQYDNFDATGAVSLGGATLNLSGSFTPTDGQTFAIVAGGTCLSGAFNSYPDGQQFAFNGHAMTIHYLGAPNDEVELTAVTAPAITSASQTTFVAGAMGMFTVTTTGFPTPGLSYTGTLPANVTLMDNDNGTATLSGTPPVGSTGPFTIYITANNGITPNDTQTFTLTVAAASTFTTVSSSTRGHSTYGGSVTFTAAVVDAHNVPITTGTVAFDIDGAPYVTGVPLDGSGHDLAGFASFTINSLSVLNSPHQITAIYSGATNLYATSQGNVNQAIAPATLTYSANSAQRLYGAANPTFSGAVSGFVLGQNLATATTGGTPSFTSSATASSNVGSYPIDGSGLTAINGNYTFVQAASNATALTVGKAALTVVVNDKTKAYGAPLPTLDGTLTGVLNNDGIIAVYTTTATAASHVAGSPYPITAILQDPNGRLSNYTVSNTPGTLTITKANQAISWSNPASIPYGTPLGGAQLDARVTANPGPAGALSYSPLAGTILPFGSQSLTVTVAGTGDYNQAVATVTINVSKASLTVTAANKTMVYGTPVPALTGTLTGAVAAANADGITGTYTTSATSASNAGSYPISAAFSDPNNKLSNYTVTEVPGTLTITQAPATVTLNPASLSAVANGGAHAVTATTTAPGVSTITFTYNGSATAPSAAGAYAVVATLHNIDYTGSATGTLTIAPPVVVGTSPVTLGNLSQTYTGIPLAATVTTNPPNLTVNVTYASATYPSSSTPPTLAGSYTVTASIASGQSAAGSARETLVIAKAVPVILWNPPATIAYGAPLTAAYLNATASVAGNFVYTPSVGTLLPKGMNTIQVTFTPLDATDYVTVTMTVVLTVV